MFSLNSTGSSRVSGSGIIGTSGQAININKISFAGVGGTGIVTLRNGSTSSGTAYIIHQVGSLLSDTFWFGDQGFLFPDGCYIDMNIRVSSVTVEYST